MYIGVHFTAIHIGYTSSAYEQDVVNKNYVSCKDPGVSQLVNAWLQKY